METDKILILVTDKILILILVITDKILIFYLNLVPKCVLDFVLNFVHHLVLNFVPNFVPNIVLDFVLNFVPNFVLRTDRLTDKAPSISDSLCCRLKISYSTIFYKPQAFLIFLEFQKNWTNIAKFEKI